MSERLQKSATQFISDFVSKNVDEIVKPLYYPEDFLKLNLSNIDIPDSWIFEECMDDYDDMDIIITNHLMKIQDTLFIIKKNLFVKRIS